MNRKLNVLVLLAFGILIVIATAFSFRQQILIAYHKDRYLTACENFSCLTGQGKTPTLLQQIKFSFCNMRGRTEADAMNFHREVLMRLGYLHEHEFQFTNRFCNGTNGRYLYQCMTNAFNGQPFWTAGFLTNRIEVTAPLEDMPKWKKLVEDFDR